MRTAFYRGQFKLAVEAQAELLEDWTPDDCVPEFNVARAAGVPGHWNYLQPREKRGKKQEHIPPLTRGDLKIERVMEFLRVRDRMNDLPILYQFQEQVAHSNGW